MNLENMQQNHESDKMAFLTKNQGEKNALKEEFFANNHLDTGKGPDGKSKVLTQNGKPIVRSGKENAPQKMARMNFESQQKTQMFARHASEKTQFVQQQKGQLLTFLDGNKFQLHNPGIQGELQKIIADSQKKAIGIQERHELEFAKVDLPPVKEMANKVEADQQKYRDMIRKQMEEQKNSPGAMKLADYQQDLVTLLDSKRAEAREQKRAELFLRDPRKMLKNPPRQDLAAVLPMNMVIALEQFGINDLPA